MPRAFSYSSSAIHNILNHILGGFLKILKPPLGGKSYIEAQGYVPLLLENLFGMSCPGTFWPLCAAWFQCRYGGI